jgi:hypothetical protein
VVDYHQTAREAYRISIPEKQSAESHNNKVKGLGTRPISPVPTLTAKFEGSSADYVRHS